MAPHTSVTTIPEASRKALSDAADEIERLQRELAETQAYYREQIQMRRITEPQQRIAELETALQSARAALPESPFDKIGADRLADEVAVLIQRRIIDARSPTADALLDYRETMRTERSDRLATLDAELETARAELRAVGELLARIHRDGGHYQADHGTLKAIKDAEAKVIELLGSVHELESAQQRITALSDSEQFWREAVKNARGVAYIEYEDVPKAKCPFCFEEGDVYPCDPEFDTRKYHEPNCAWMLATEE